MTRNHASGGVRVSVARSHARRQSVAEMRAMPFPDRSSRIAVIDMWRFPRLPDYLRPGGHPTLEWHTVVLAVVAGGQRRLPELDGLEVRRRLIGVVGRARALLD